tara:strand:- start:113974 stop:114471 length:498 start_codon:yes stop_codon:yes gene_type:complete
MTNFNSLNARPIGDISEEHVHRITDFLNNLLANEYALFTKTLNYHWNVTGPRFHSMHNFLEDQYKSLLTIMDDVAERVRVVGETPISTVSSLKNAMDITETNGERLSANDMLKDLFETHLMIQTSMKNLVKDESLFTDDPGTEDFLVGLLQTHEEMSWMIKSHLV